MKSLKFFFILYHVIVNFKSKLYNTNGVMVCNEESLCHK